MNKCQECGKPTPLKTCTECIAKAIREAQAAVDAARKVLYEDAAK